MSQLMGKVQIAIDGWAVYARALDSQGNIYRGNSGLGIAFQSNPHPYSWLQWEQVFDRGTCYDGHIFDERVEVNLDNIPANVTHIQAALFSYPETGGSRQIGMTFTCKVTGHMWNTQMSQVGAISLTRVAEGWILNVLPFPLVDTHHFLQLPLPN
jgi:hypothetical protein